MTIFDLLNCWSCAAKHTAVRTLEALNLMSAARDKTSQRLKTADLLPQQKKVLDETENIFSTSSGFRTKNHCVATHGAPKVKILSFCSLTNN